MKHTLVLRLTDPIYAAPMGKRYAEKHMISRALALRLLWGVCLIAVIVGSLLPGNSAPMVAIESLGVSDKLQHCAAYAVLAFLPCIYERRRVVVMLLTLAAAMGVLLEFGQLFSPGRSFDVYDMLADGVGIVIGAAIALPIRLRFAARAHDSRRHTAACSESGQQIMR